jgi:hypothetical protein
VFFVHINVYNNNIKCRILYTLLLDPNWAGIPYLRRFA